MLGFAYSSVSLCIEDSIKLEKNVKILLNILCLIFVTLCLPWISEDCYIFAKNHRLNVDDYLPDPQGIDHDILVFPFEQHGRTITVYRLV